MKSKIPKEAYNLIEDEINTDEYDSSTESENESLNDNFEPERANEISDNIIQFENRDEQTDTDSEMPDHFFLIEYINKKFKKKLF